mmetsp:Transcript_31750/g.62230  ORF Transcript_31750/g.62230 Transcript_31750/m.62230 type:complete len:226 (-) Transcript_31750:42-719(-)
MGLLRHVWSCGEASSDGPNWLVRNGNIGPVIFAEDISNRLQLRSAHFHGSSSLTLFLLFSNAEHNLQTLLESLLRLCSHESAILSSHAKSLPSLTVPKNDPGNSDILELASADLSSVGSSSGETAVLSGDFDIVAEAHEAERDVDEGTSDDNVAVGGDGPCRIELGDELFDRFDGSIRFPVSTDKVLALTFRGFCSSGGSGGSLAAVGECHISYDVERMTKYNES